MNRQIFRSFLLGGSLLIGFQESRSQVLYTPGAELGNDKSIKMTRFINGDDQSFYCYRVQNETDPYIIEKYNKSDLSRVFSRSLTIFTQGGGSRVDDVQLAAGNIFIFSQNYDKENQKMTLNFRTLSTSGDATAPQEVITVSCDHYEFVNFDILLNPSKTKFLVKTAHKENSEAAYKTDLTIIDALQIKRLGTRRINQDLRSPGKQMIAYFPSFKDLNFGICGLYFDDNDRIYYCVTDPMGEADHLLMCKMSLYTLNPDESTPRQLALPIGDNNYVREVKILKSGEGLELAGFFQEVAVWSKNELVKCGLFRFKVNTAGSAITNQVFFDLDNATLTSLQSTKKNANDFHYKLDQIISVDNSLYYVGQQYKEHSAGLIKWDYEYRNILVLKLNANSELQWIGNIPLLYTVRLDYRHLFRQSIIFSTDKNLYVLFNDSPENMKYFEQGSKRKTIIPSGAIHGSHFVCNAINLRDGTIKRSSIFKNETYCYAPIRERRTKFVLSSEETVHIPLDQNSIYVYTENRGADKFDKIKFE